MMNPYAILGGALGGLLLLIGAYFYGRNDGKMIEQGAQARVERAVAKERAKNEAAADDGNVAGQSAEMARSSNTKEVYREVQKFIDRPVYGVGCIDADGVRVLERAAANSNGKDTGQPAGGTRRDPAAANPARRDTERTAGAGNAAGPL